MKLPNSDDLSSEQIQVFTAALRKDLLVSGPPGTGKTVMALYRAQMISRKDAGTKFWLIMYNRLLGQYTQGNLGDGGFTNADSVGARIRTKHKWMYAWGRRWGMGNAEIAPYVYDWNGIVSTLATTPPHVQKRAFDWDHLIIDEGQDFAPGFYRMLSFVKTMAQQTIGKSMTLTVFADENQRISKDENSSIEDIEREMNYSGGTISSLTINYRNSRQIAKLASAFYVGLPTGIPSPPSRSGPLAPSLISYSNQSIEIEAIAAFALQNEDLTIGVILQTDFLREQVYTTLDHYLSSSTPKVQTYKSRMSADELASIKVEASGSITVICGASCKGLEFDAVFIPRLESYSLDPGQATEFKMNLYVRISRARDYLFLSFYSQNGDHPDILEYFPNDLVSQCKRVDKPAMYPMSKVTSNQTAKSTPDSNLPTNDETLTINGFTLENYGKAILIKGDTRPIKEDIKRMGGKWFRKENCWMFGGRRRKEVIAFLDRQKQY
jgi:DNA helicase-2/ATP-dependent DNA helicase PcrA